MLDITAPAYGKRWSAGWWTRRADDTFALQVRVPVDPGLARPPAGLAGRRVIDRFPIGDYGIMGGGLAVSWHSGSPPGHVDPSNDDRTVMPVKLVRAMPAFCGQLATLGMSGRDEPWRPGVDA
jgi:hypothetical protein